MEHETSLITRSYECDSYGHVNNAVYLNYLEYARIQMLENLKASYSALRRRGIGFVVVRICIDYKAQVGAGETLRIVTRPVRKERARVLFSQRIFRHDEPVADAEVTWACIDNQGRPVRLPPELDVPELEP